jgi:hypothetical protein
MNTHTLLRFGLIFFISQLPTGRLRGAAEDLGQITERGPHHRVVETQSGARYTELETGMHFWDPQANDWTESSAEIVIDANGASAIRGLHQVYFSGNLAETPSAIWVTPQGKQWKSRVLGISYYNRVTHQSVWIAELKPQVQGVLHPPNRVIYGDAFDSISAEVHFAYTKSAFSSTILLLNQPPSPAAFGLDPATSSLEVVTELFDLPVLEKDVRQITLDREGQPSMPDEAIKLGDANIANGSAFLIEVEGTASVPVCKTLTRIDNRDLLFESVDYTLAKRYLDTLPQVAALQKQGAKIAQGRSVPVRKEAKTAKKSVQVAAVARTSTKGFWIDWEGTLSGNTNDYVFAPNATTYISGSVTLSGNSNYLMGGTIIKFAPTNSAQLNVSGKLICQTSPYRMAVLTARDDHTVGSPVGNAALSGFYGNVALWFSNADENRDLSYIRIAHIKKAIGFYAGTVNTLIHSQIIDCGHGLEINNATAILRNCLMHQVRTNFTSNNSSGSSARCEHLTVDVSTRLNDNSWVSLYLTNTLLVNVTTNGAGYQGSAGLRTDSGSSVFTIVGAGAHYLPSTSSHRGAGVTIITTSLADALKTMTVDAPTVLTDPCTENVTFFPQVQRGLAPGQSNYTVGYWYPPIDYCLSGVVVTNATVVLTNGVAVATFGESGLRIDKEAGFASQGGPLIAQRNHILRYSAVQEQSTNWGGGSVTTNRAVEPYQYGSIAPTGLFRFTDFDGLAGSGYHLYANGTNTIFGTLTIQDCELNGATARIAGSEAGRITLKNNLFLGVETSFRDQPEINAYNNLFHRGALDVQPTTSTNVWTFKDNVLERVAVTQVGKVTNDYNGYITNATAQWLTNSGSHDIFTNKFGWQTGLLSRFYQPTSSLFLNVGSRSVTNAGLYWYTCLTNNVQDTNTVDLGYHLIALDGSGQPLDTDGDGLSSWWEDLNGNGVFDLGESNWNSYNSLNGLSGTPGLQVFTPLK